MEQDQIDQVNSAAAGGSIVGGIIMLAIVLFLVASIWKMFVKAGEPGWAAIVPIYNLVVMLKISGKPVWWIILFLIPGINFIMSILTSLGTAEKFGKSAGFGIGIAFLPFIFLPILGFGSATYIGPKTA